MKKLLVTLAAVLVTMSTYGQGEVRFHNRPASGDARVTRPDGTGAGAGITAQLFLVGAGGGLTALTPTTTFRSTSAAAAYFLTEVIVQVPGVPAGSPGTFRVRAWETSAGSYEAAAAGAGLFGQSGDVTIAQLGGTPAVGAPIPTPELTGLQGFALAIVPEPSTMALGLLGAAGLLLRRRK